MSASLNDRPNKVEVSGDAATVTAGAGVQGAQGEPGIIISATEPTETDVLWADTSAAGSMVVPAGGSTGQVLAKASGDDYDSEWITPSSGGIPATIIDAKGDLIVGTAADTAARLAVGSDDSVLMAASGQTAGVRWAAPFAPSLLTWPANKDWTWRIGSLAVALTADRIIFLGFVCTRSQTISALVASCSTGVASTSILMGVYSSNADGSPNALLVSGSASSATNGGKTVSLSPSLSLTAGTSYFLAAMATGGTPSFHGSDANNGSYGNVGPLSTDNLARGSIWFKTAAVSGVLDATITGATFGFTGVTKPNIGVTVASAP